MLKTVLTTAALGLAVVSTPALAGSGQAQSVSVTFADLDLSTAEGADELDRRIDNAARQACYIDYKRTGSRMRTSDSKACYAKARKSVERQVAVMVEQAQRGG